MMYLPRTIIPGSSSRAIRNGWLSVGQSCNWSGKRCWHVVQCFTRRSDQNWATPETDFTGPLQQLLCWSSYFGTYRKQRAKYGSDAAKNDNTRSGKVSSDFLFISERN